MSEADGSGLVIVTDPAIIAAITDAIGKGGRGPKTGGRYSGSGGWSNFGTLTAGSQDNQVSLQCLFARAADYTVEFSVGNLDFASGEIAGIANPVATIVWSVEGNDVRRQVNVVNGMSVTGVGQAVKVTIEDATTDATVFGNEYSVSVQVSPGTRGSTRIQPFLVAEQGTISGVGLSPTPFLLNPGQDVLVPIPSDAGIQAVYVLTDAPVTTSVVNHNVGPTSFNSYDPTVYKWVPLWPGTSAVDITNNDTTAHTYAVYFGVDG